ncbi:hypothetical protein BC629DRAFT_497570 [Irpex lacteus]|nr:hypothetical protein BC629DRAFT_497570 [Irpex lacteus]
MTSLPASSSTTFTSSSNSQPHHASITAGTSRSQSQLVSEAGRSGGMLADGYPHGTQPRAFDESASRVSYGYSHPARSSSSPPSFSPLSASSSSSVVPFPPGIPASTPYAHDPRDADTDSAQTRDSPKHRRSPTRHRPRPGSTNEYQEAVLDQHTRYRRAYSQSDDALHHLYQQHSTLPPQSQPHAHSESQPRMPSRNDASECSNDPLTPSPARQERVTSSILLT